MGQSLHCCACVPLARMHACTPCLAYMHAHLVLPARMQAHLAFPTCMPTRLALPVCMQVPLPCSDRILILLTDSPLPRPGPPTPTPLSQARSFPSSSAPCAWPQPWPWAACLATARACMQHHSLRHCCSCEPWPPRPATAAVVVARGLQHGRPGPAARPHPHQPSSHPPPRRTPLE